MDKNGSRHICFYFDENIDQRLVRVLQNAGVDVRSPKEFGMLGEKNDALQLEKAIELSSVLVTADKGFRKLHLQWLEEGKHHKGIILVRGEQNRLEGDLADKLINLHQARRSADMVDLLLLM